MANKRNIGNRHSRIKDTANLRTGRLMQYGAPAAGALRKRLKALKYSQPATAPRHTVRGNPVAPVQQPGPPISLAPPSLPPPPIPALGPPYAPMATASIGPVEVKPPATLACPLVSALDKWISEAVQPAALNGFASRWSRSNNSAGIPAAA